MAILVDTGALELLRRQDRRAEALIVRHYPPLICTHVVAEFLYGQNKAKVPAATFQRAREFLDSFEVLAPTFSTASVYARIRTDLTTRGIILPDPDIWIAAHAIENRMRLLSTDKHFEHFPDLNYTHLPQVESQPSGNT